MPYRMLGKTMRNLSVWRLGLLILVVYAIIRLAIPWLVEAGVPFWARAAFLALGPVVGAGAGPWLFPRRR